VEVKRCVNVRQNETAIDARGRMRMGVFCFCDFGFGAGTEYRESSSFAVVVRSFDRFRIITNGRK
jgi:hypothetical protein